MRSLSSKEWCWLWVNGIFFIIMSIIIAWDLLSLLFGF